MKRITSFEIDHKILDPGFYISRKDGSITTYDLRTRKPNSDDYMDNITMHTVEHMFATFARNSKYSDKIIYFGPMGCQTGFYLLTDSMDDNDVFDLTREILSLIINYNGKVFGASEAREVYSGGLACGRTFEKWMDDDRCCKAVHQLAA